MKRTLEAAIVAALILTAMVTAVRNSLTESQAFDEGVYLAAGMSYLRAGDFRMNPEHPPLAKLLAGVAAISVNLLYGFGNRYSWLRAFTPIDTIGHSIYLYAIEPNS